MKLLFIIAGSFCFFFSKAQEPTYHKVALKVVTSKGALPTVIDTLFLNKEYKTNDRFVTNISLQNGCASLLNIENGRYIFKMAKPDYFAVPQPVVVCSKCSNEVEMIVYKMDEGASAYFTSVEVSPSYFGGYTSLRKEFKKNLSSKEFKKLKAFPADVTIHFFITKNDEVSDATFSKEPSAELRNIISKGLYSLKNWRPAMINGKPIDGEYTLKTEDIL